MCSSPYEGCTWADVFLCFSAMALMFGSSSSEGSSGLALQFKHIIQYNLQDAHTLSLVFCWQSKVNPLMEIPEKRVNHNQTLLQKVGSCENTLYYLSVNVVFQCSAMQIKIYQSKTKQKLKKKGQLLNVDIMLKYATYVQPRRQEEQQSQV